MSLRKQLIQKAWEPVAKRLSEELGREITIEEAHEIVAKLAKEDRLKEEERRIQEEKTRKRWQKEQRAKRERCRREIEKGRRNEEEIRRQQQIIKYNYGINEEEERARLREFKKKRIVQEEKEKHAWKFRLPNESVQDWKARIRKHNAEQRATFKVYTKE